MAENTDNSTKFNSSTVVDVPVLIIGGGPSGLLQAWLLSQLGITTLIVERYPERLGAPKAHALSPRSLEICRQFGLDTGYMRSLGTRREDAYWVNFLTTLSGNQLGRLPYERMDLDVLEATPEMIHNIPQPDFESYVAEQLIQRNNAEIRKGVSFLSLQQHNDFVDTIVEERATSSTYVIRSHFVIACDGARSKVREFIGIESDGEDSYETMMTIHFKANLREVVGDRVGMLHWLFDPMASGFIIAYDLSGNAVLISNFDSEKHSIDKWDEDLCREVLLGAIGKDLSPTILSYRPWILNRRVAKHYRQGNVFLAGDAAHSFPPTGGLGLNSGLADVHNLAFKIAAVLQGNAKVSLLKSYSEERQHIAEINSRQSVKNGQRIFSLLKTLGTAGTSDIDQARQNLLKALNDEQTKREVDIGVEEQREHFDNLNLHIGYVYGDSSIPAHASRFVPSFKPGARLPHAWIVGDRPPGLSHLKAIDLSYLTEPEKEHMSGKKYSTLDLCAFDAWTMLLPSENKALETISQGLCEQKSKLIINTFIAGQDFDVYPNSAGSSWLKNSGLEAGRALLVRPDQHIFCTFDEMTEISNIKKALDGFLGM